MRFGDFVDVADGNGREWHVTQLIIVRVQGHEDGRFVPFLPHEPTEIARCAEAEHERQNPQDSTVIQKVNIKNHCLKQRYHLSSQLTRHHVPN